MRFALCCAIVIPSIAGRTQTVGNAFVGAVVTNGLITIYKGNPANKEQLTFIEKSFLTVAVNTGGGIQYYSNNISGGKVGPAGTPHPIDFNLVNDHTLKTKDTIKTVWIESGFDIVQKVYPVAFSSSGVIVISISIVNHGGIAIGAQAQYLLDNMNSNTITPPLNANDNPFLIERYGVVNTWRDCPSSPLPSFYLAFENGLTSLDLGTVGIGYMNDSFPPRSIGLTPLSFMEFGCWFNQVDYTWGPPDGADRNCFNDEATLMQGQNLAATAYEAGVSDSVTEIMRTAYGTPEWCFQHGNIFGFALYPQHINWDPQTMTYSPNPFQVQTFLFNVTPSQTSNTTMRQTVGEPIHIVNPPPAGPTSDTTQQQNVPNISGNGFSTVNWTDSVLILPTGCAASFPVDIHFDVKASDINQPVFVAPWDCSIQVDCANPDILPPSFQNSFAGCDSIMYDTVIVQEGRQYDLGLDTITYTSKDLTPAQYSVTITPPPPYKCVTTPVKIVVHQIDTFSGGHVIFKFTDCAKNVSTDTVCFTAHSPLPDKTPPHFWIDSIVADCNAQCTEWNVTDTVTSATSIDRGVDSIVVVSSKNMMLSGVPIGGEYQPATRTALIRICVTDSMQDGTIILRATDTSDNIKLDTFKYCTTPDNLAPILVQKPFNIVTNSWHVHASDTQAWDRGIDSIWLEQATNVVTIPSPIPYPIGCKRTFDFDVHVVDTSQCASAKVFARDCAGHKSIEMLLAFTKGTIPVIIPFKTVLCSTSDSAILDAGAGFSSYLWSNGKTTQKITVGPGTYSVTVGEGLNCNAPSQPVTISFSPATTQITPAGPIELCVPDSSQLDAGAGFAAYQWLIGGVTMPGKTSEIIKVGSTGIYTVQVTNASGCVGTSQAVSVTVDPLPPQPVITSFNSLMTTDSSSSYQWSRNGVIIPGPDGTKRTYLDTVGGTYTVTITDADGCSSTSLPFSNAGTTQIAVAYPAVVYAHESNHLMIPLSIISSVGLATPINRKFTAVISFNKTLLIPDGAPTGGTMNMAVGTTDNVVTYTANTMATMPGSVIASLPFIAALGNDSCTGITLQSFVWNAPGITVTLQNGKFCDSDLCQQGGTRLINPDGTVSISAPKPNPAYSSVQIDYRLIEHGKTTLVISDLLGREVLRLVDADQEPGTYTVDADISMLPAGTYLYSLRTPTIVKSNHLEITR